LDGKEKGKKIIARKRRSLGRILAKKVEEKVIARAQQPQSPF